MKKNLLICIFFLLSACGGTSNDSDKKVELPKFSTEAHRGGRGIMPENTIIAMLNALNYDISTLEMDVYISKDKKVVLAHDPSINPSFTLDHEGNEITKSKEKNLVLYSLNYSQIKKFDVGSKENIHFPNKKNIKAQIPLLSELIDQVQAQIKKTGRKQVFYNIEIKSRSGGDGHLHPTPEKFVNLVISLIEDKKITPWVTIQSFDTRPLRIINEKYPNIKTSYLVSDGELEANLDKLGFTPDIYSPYYKLVSKDLVMSAHNKNMLVIPWTPNTQEEINHLKKMGVDGVISDYLEILN